MSRLWLAAESCVGDVIQRSLADFQLNRFPYVIKILHPAPTKDLELTTWAEIAAAVGSELTPATDFKELNQSTDPDAFVEGVFMVPPATSQLPAELMDLNLETLPGGVLYGLLWEGHGRPAGRLLDSAKVKIEGFDYFALRSGGTENGMQLQPNIITDRQSNWLMVTNIDYTFTTFCCLDGHTIASIEALKELETIRFR